MLGPMNKLQNEDFKIAVFDDTTHKIGLIDNKFTYTKYYFCESECEFPVSRLGIKIFNNNKEEIANSLVIGFAGQTDFYKNSYLIDGNQLLVCCCDTIICLTIPSLDVNWKKSFGESVCLKILNKENYYLVYGKTQVTKIDGNGTIKQKYKSENDFISL